MSRYSWGQDVVTSFISHAWDFFKQESEISKVKAMTPSELAAWRREEVGRINQQAVRLSQNYSEKDLVKLGSRYDITRRFEVLLRNDRGVLFSQYLLEGMDVRGLDISKFRKGALKQDHIERAIGDKNTMLPPDIVRPASWQ